MRQRWLCGLAAIAAAFLSTAAMAQERFDNLVRDDMFRG